MANILLGACKFINTSELMYIKDERTVKMAIY